MPAWNCGFHIGTSRLIGRNADGFRQMLGVDATGMPSVQCVVGLRGLVGVLCPSGQLSGQLCCVDDDHAGFLSVGFTTRDIPLERGREAAGVAVPVLVPRGTVLAECYHRWELERLSTFSAARVAFAHGGIAACASAPRSGILAGSHGVSEHLNLTGITGSSRTALDVRPLEDSAGSA